MANTAKKPKAVVPLRPSEWGLTQHKTRQFNALVPGTMTVDELEDPAFWASVASQMEIHCEIRCVADDTSFVAYGICTYAQGAIAKVKILNMYDLDTVEPDDMEGEHSDYEIKLRGPKKWCVVQKSTGDVIKEGIPTQIEAMRELDDFKRALRS